MPDPSPAPAQPDRLLTPSEVAALFRVSCCRSLPTPVPPRLDCSSGPGLPPGPGLVRKVVEIHCGCHTRLLP